MEVFVARQAIFDRNRQLHAYELLYRSDPTQTQFDGTESGVATQPRATAQLRTRRASARQSAALTRNSVT